MNFVYFSPSNPPKLHVFYIKKKNPMRLISAAHIGAGMVLFPSGTWSTYEVPHP